MGQERSFDRSGQLTRLTRAAAIERLRHTPSIEELSLVGLKAVTATRLLAVCGHAGRDPLLELTQRFACVTTAKAFVDFADQVGMCWPENVRVMRPCCRMLSPCESTIAQLIDAGLAGDRQRFDAVLRGFVRLDRHERLYARATKLAVLMQ